MFRKLLNIPEQQGILFDMSLGYADPDAAINRARAIRKNIGNSVTF